MAPRNCRFLCRTCPEVYTSIFQRKSGKNPFRKSGVFRVDGSVFEGLSGPFWGWSDTSSAPHSCWETAKWPQKLFSGPIGPLLVKPPVKNVPIFFKKTSVVPVSQEKKHQTIPPPRKIQSRIQSEIRDENSKTWHFCSVTFSFVKKRPPLRKR